MGSFHTGKPLFRLKPSAEAFGNFHGEMLPVSLLCDRQVVLALNLSEFPVLAAGCPKGMIKAEVPSPGPFHHSSPGLKMDCFCLQRYLRRAKAVPTF